MSMSGKRQLDVAGNFVLGGAAAIAFKTVEAPLERVKLLLQNQGEIVKSGRLPEPYKGITDCVVRTFRSEGILPFWRGNLVNCLGYLPTQVLSFAFKDKFKDLFKVSKTDRYAVKFCKNTASGGAAGVLSLWFVYSLHYCRIRLANDVKIGNKRQFNGIIDVYKKTLASDGIVGLYRGFIISCIGIFVYRGCYFGFYDTLKPIFLGENAGTFASLCLGFGVTISAGLVSYPLDTIHSRMMMRSCEAVKYKGSLDCFMQIVRNEGYMALMRGVGVNIFRGIFGAGLLAGFDKCKKYYRTK